MVCVLPHGQLCGTIDTMPGMDTVQYNLPQDRIPRAWYNIAADLPDSAGATVASWDVAAFRS